MWTRDVLDPQQLELFAVLAEKHTQPEIAFIFTKAIPKLQGFCFHIH